MNYKHLSIALFIVAALLLPGAIKGAFSGYQSYQNQKEENIKTIKLMHYDSCYRVDLLSRRYQPVKCN